MEKYFLYAVIYPYVLDRRFANRQFNVYGFKSSPAYKPTIDFYRIGAIAKNQEESKKL